MLTVNTTVTVAYCGSCLWMMARMCVRARCICHANSLILSSPNCRQHSTHLYGVIAQKECPPERTRAQKCEMFVLCYGYCNCHHKFSYEWFLFQRFI